MARSRVTIAVGSAIAGMAATGVAYAAIPDAGGTIHACYNTGNVLSAKGTVRVVDSAADCQGWERALTWNQTGAPGAQGPAGPTGPSGSAGPAGPAGVTGTRIVKKQVDLAPNAAVGTRIDCGSDLVTGGGYSSSSGLEYYESIPETAHNWLITIRNPTSTDRVANVYAVCLNITG